MISEMAVVGEHFCFILSGHLLTFQDILARLTVYRYVWSHLVELSFAAGRLEKTASLILFAVVPNDRKSLTDPFRLCLYGQYFWRL